MEPIAPTRLQVGDLLLREFLPTDLADLTAAFADPDISTWNPGPADADGVAALMVDRNDWSAGDHASWAVADADNRLVGAVSLHKIDLDQGDSEIGYWVAPWARRRRVASRSVTAAASYGFVTLGVRRVHLFHAVENAASCGVASAAGFLLEGTLRQSYRYADGIHHDEHLHARLASD